MALSLSSDVLIFTLEKNASPRVTLKLKNTSSSSRVVYKVRTTQPMWYYVRPNQDVLEPEQEVDLVFTLTDLECRRFLDLHRVNKEESVDKHRFMVQGMPLGQTDFDALSSIPVDSPARAEEYTRIWETRGKEDKSVIRLKVQYQYPEVASRSSAPRGASSPTGTGGDDDINAINSNLNNGVGGGVTADSSYEACWAELQQLHRKYDQVREYTVHLTAERDTVVSKLERLQSELAQQEQAREGGGRRRNGDAAMKQAARGIALSDFSLFAVLVAAVVSFLVGYYVSR